MSVSNGLRRILRTARKASGRIRRKTVQLPEGRLVRPVNKIIRFEHMNLSFLDEDDMKAMLTASYDITLCDYLRRSLSSGDIALDVGANVGYISAFMASCVGKSGEVHGFEPLPECFGRLEALRSLNPGFHFFFNQMALGEASGWLPISYDPKGNARNATLVPTKSDAGLMKVHVKRLDQYIAEQIPLPQRIRLIKIDTEGFEFPVLRGLEGFFASAVCRPLIVCEIKPWVLKKMAYTLGDFDQYLKRFGYTAYDLESERTVSLPSLKEMSVLLFRT